MAVEEQIVVDLSREYDARFDNANGRYSVGNLPILWLFRYSALMIRWGTIDEIGIVIGMRFPSAEFDEKGQPLRRGQHWSKAAPSTRLSQGCREKCLGRLAAERD
jgi:hypothetical protein